MIRNIHCEAGDIGALKELAFDQVYVILCERGIREFFALAWVIERPISRHSKRARVKNAGEPIRGRIVVDVLVRLADEERIDWQAISSLFNCSMEPRRPSKVAMPPSRTVRRRVRSYSGTRLKWQVSPIHRSSSYRSSYDSSTSMWLSPRSGPARTDSIRTSA